MKGITMTNYEEFFKKIQEQAERFIEQVGNGSLYDQIYDDEGNPLATHEQVQELRKKLRDQSHLIDTGGAFKEGKYTARHPSTSIFSSIGDEAEKYLEEQLKDEDEVEFLGFEDDDSLSRKVEIVTMKQVRDEAIAEGFSREEAFKIVIEWQRLKREIIIEGIKAGILCLLYTSPSPRDS